MKNSRIITAIVAAMIMFTTTTNLFAQSPEAFNYQGLARDAQGKSLVNTSVSIKASVLTASPTGAVEYAETQIAQTDSFGLFSVAIGNGTPINGTFANITWGNATKFLKIEFDPNGGSNYILAGTSQMLSVPYALYAKNAKNYIAGSGITISADTIKAKKHIAGNRITISNDTINSKSYIAGEGITISNDTVKAKKYIAGNNITINNDTINAIGGGSGINGMRVITGKVTGANNVATIDAGTGFTVTYSTSSGEYVITFTTPFATPPYVISNGIKDNTSMETISTNIRTITTNQVKIRAAEIQTQGYYLATDMTINFMIMGN